MWKALTVSNSDRLYVPTDAKGVEYHLEAELLWPLPAAVPGQARPAPGEWLHSSDVKAAPPVAGLPLFSLDGLLDELGERIFIAEIATSSGAESNLPGVVEVDSARLIDETAWNVKAAAHFALDCAEHVLADPASLKLGSGASVADVLRAAHSWLDSSEGDTSLLGRFSRIATARRLRRHSGEVGDLAFSVTLEDEASDVDALDDPDWTALAAARDAVLSAVEAIRHQAIPQLLEAENVRYEEDGGALQLAAEPVSTPWGSFVAGRRAGIVPAWVAARDAAERARRAATDANGAEAGDEERAWQRLRLARALGRHEA
jgi:hypothetical protein